MKSLLTTAHTKETRQLTNCVVTVLVLSVHNGYYNITVQSLCALKDTDGIGNKLCTVEQISPVLMVP